jgi:adenylate cyclase
MATGHAQLTAARRWRPTRRDLRLGSGLTLFVYVATHMATHAAGLHSVALAERALRVAVALWHSLPGSIVLYGAAAIHIALALHSIYQRRTLRIPPLDVLRIALGLAIPTLLIGHAAATRLAFEMYGHLPTYTRTVWNLWTSDNEGRQLALLAPGWLHGCLGVYYAFNRREAFMRWRLVWFGLALLLPVLSAVGFFAMGKELAGRAADLAWLAANAVPVEAGQRIALLRIRDGLLAAYFGAIVAVFVARALRDGWERQRGALVRIAYPGRSVTVPRGWTVLEASRGHHIAHQSVCGGRARCSTCRVRVTAGAAHCAPPNADEAATLARIGAADDIRLACQLRPDGDIAVVPLLEVERRKASTADAIESELVILEADLAGWCEAAGGLLPQDRLFLLDAFSEAAGAAIRQAGGAPNPLNGDGSIGLFSTRPASRAAQQALSAAAVILAQVGSLRAQLPGQAGAALDIAIRVHAGLAASGPIGHGPVRTMVATGPAVDTLRRMAAGTPHGQVRISQHALELAGVSMTPEDPVQTLTGDPPLRVIHLSLARLQAAAPNQAKRT